MSDILTKMQIKITVIIFAGLLLGLCFGFLSELIVPFIGYISLIDEFKKNSDTKFWNILWIGLLELAFAALVPVTLLLLRAPLIFKYSKYLSFIATSYVFGRILFYSVLYLSSQQEIRKYDGFCLFLISNIVYHLGEFFFVCYCHPINLSWSSFLINHSLSYSIAIISGLVEYFIEIQYIYTFKTAWWLYLLGAVFSTIGHIFRLGAFISARSNFTHLIAFEKLSSHKLVTSGIYRLSRHPSYFGFFVYALGGQLFLGNIICIFLYYIVLMTFFYKRILIEEELLIDFFGQEYENYRKKTPILIPLLQCLLDRENSKNRLFQDN